MDCVQSQLFKPLCGSKLTCDPVWLSLNVPKDQFEQFELFASGYFLKNWGHFGSEITHICRDFGFLLWVLLIKW